METTTHNETEITYDNTTIHCLKIRPIYFNDILYGNKRFEFRYNDRDFNVGDTVILQEYHDQQYTGRALTVTIKYVLKDCSCLDLPLFDYFPTGMCIFCW